MDQDDLWKLAQGMPEDGGIRLLSTGIQWAGSPMSREWWEKEIPD